MKTAKKYLSLSNNIEKTEKLRDKYQSGFFYNPLKSDSYSKKLKSYRITLLQIESQLSEEEKHYINDFFGTDYFDIAM